MSLGVEDFEVSWMDIVGIGLAADLGTSAVATAYCCCALYVTKSASAIQGRPSRSM